MLNIAKSMFYSIVCLIALVIGGWALSSYSNWEFQSLKIDGEFVRSLFFGFIVLFFCFYITLTRSQPEKKNTRRCVHTSYPPLPNSMFIGRFSELLDEAERTLKQANIFEALVLDMETRCVLFGKVTVEQIDTLIEEMKPQVPTYDFHMALVQFSAVCKQEIMIYSHEASLSPGIGKAPSAIMCKKKTCTCSHEVPPSTRIEKAANEITSLARAEKISGYSLIASLKQRLDTLKFRLEYLKDEDKKSKSSPNENTPVLKGMEKEAPSS